MSALGSPVRAYDFLLKFLLVGDSDVGKGEILASLQDGAAESPYGHPAGIDHKTTTILLDGRRVKLQLWDTSGQGRFCTIFRSYSRGAQGVILVYDIANRWSFDGINRWIKEIDEHAPGVPRILVGNRLHLAFKRQERTLRRVAAPTLGRGGGTWVESSVPGGGSPAWGAPCGQPWVGRNSSSSAWFSPPSQVLSLQDLCCRAVVSCTPVHLVDKLPLPLALRSHLKSFSMANGLNARMMHGRSYSLTASTPHKRTSLRKAKTARAPQSPPGNCAGSSCKVS
ncbi:Ras-related protein Rab-40B [Heterocephalus glaber]|uniref:small monomeric GTPase n=1 Tax=Heterocephalus glaber TaxID=10181 RepID=G5BJB1_HETGA|nr:Ras-related protein Rab-40B [Heterocephalus glaber]